MQLFVSGDRGARWDLYWKVPATQQSFLFRAGNDGEYWFCVRTLDSSGRLSPGGPFTPGLRVVVDTAPPKVQMEARRGESGQILLRWQVEEPNLKPESLKIQYRINSNALWQPVAVGRQDMRSAGSIHTGEISWLAPAAAVSLDIRAEVADLAGNPAVSQVVLAENRSTASSNPDPRAPAAAVSPADTVARGVVQRAEGDSPNDQGVRAGTALSPTNWPAENSQTVHRPTADRTTGPAGTATGVSPGRTEMSMSIDGQRIDPQNGGLAIRVNPAVGNRFVGLDPKAADPRGTSVTNTGIVTVGSGIPDGERVRWVNARVFELDYDAESVGPSGIGRVELWGTRDAGRTWRSFGTDDDKRSPFVVTVDEEATYGFRIAIQNGTGNGGKPPKSGDLPQTWVGVDLTRPTGKITGAQQGVGPDANKLSISWEASDNQRLPPRCISLSFSETLGGPWTTIATGLDNSGRYAWQIDARSPQRVYLRLEVRDEAGNTATYETPQPLALDHAEPTARIRDVRPLSQPGQQYYLR